MQAVVYEVSRGGNGVLVGHGSQMLLKNFTCAFHVLIHSSKKLRIQNLLADRQLTPESAEKIIHKSDHNQKGFFRYAFNVAWDDPTLYDLIVNPGKMGLEVATALIVETSRSNGIRSCSLKALETMEMLSLERLINAALIKNDINLSQISLDVTTRGVASIGGFVHTESDRLRVIETVRAVPGVLEVKPELVVLNIAFYA